MTRTNIENGEAMSSVRGKLNELGATVDNNKLPELGTEGYLLTVVGGERDIKGPAPDGFFIPTVNEWKSVFDAGVALGQWSSTDGDSFRIKLKLPFGGYRNYFYGGISNRGSGGFYWSSSYGTSGRAYSAVISSSSALYNDLNNRGGAFSIRCFKKKPLIPSSSWNVIYQGDGNAGIFHNPTEGVISISSDGQTWITIADKNLGATTVYNDGDELSEANCGYCYQWGNNYGFPRTGTLSKTSGIAVDTSKYGPGNYYSSDTYITGNADWSSVVNNNLWGGVTDSRPEKKAEWRMAAGKIIFTNPSTVQDAQEIHNAVLKYGGENIAIKYDSYAEGGNYINSDDYNCNILTYQGYIRDDYGDVYVGDCYTFSSICFTDRGKLGVFYFTYRTGGSDNIVISIYKKCKTIDI